MQTESSVEMPFREYWQVLCYHNENNPARAKYKNLLEEESCSTAVKDDFTGQSPKDVYASIVAGILEVLRDWPADQGHAWILRNYGPRNRQLAVEEIAAVKRKSVRTIYRWLERIDDDMRREFGRRELIPS